MRPERTIQQCRWAESTLFLAEPEWLQAWEFPWSCRASGVFRPVADTRSCQVCERWRPRPHQAGCCCNDSDCR